MSNGNRVSMNNNAIDIHISNNIIGRLNSMVNMGRSKLYMNAHLVSRVSAIISIIVSAIIINDNALRWLVTLTTIGVLLGSIGMMHMWHKHRAKIKMFELLQVVFGASIYNLMFVLIANH